MSHTPLLPKTPSPSAEALSMPSLPLVPQPDSPAKKDATVLTGVFNLCNTLFGAGMLSVPFGIAQLGVLLGGLVLVLFGLISCFTLYLMTRIGEWHLSLQESRGERHPKTSFAAVAQTLLPWSPRLVSLAVALLMIGVLISYLIITSDIAVDVFLWVAGVHAPELLSTPQAWLLIIVGVLTPLCWLPTLKAQRFVSTTAMASIVVIVAVVVTFPMWGSSGTPVKIELATMNRKFFNVMSVFTFAYTCHQNFLGVQSEFSDSRTRRHKTLLVVGWTAAAAIPIYLAVGIAGYCTLGANISANILNSYPESIVMMIAQLSLMVLVMMGVPMQFNPARATIDSLFFGSMPPTWHPILRHGGISAAIIVICFTVSYFVRDLEVVLGIVGATGCSVITYILPGVFYWRAFSYRSIVEDKCRIAAAAVAVFGCVAMVVCVTFIFINATQKL